MKSFLGRKSSKNDIPLFLLDIVRRYFRIEVEGIENVPKTGRCLIVPNHSGVTALDAVMVAHEIQRSLKRIPRILAHPLWFVGPNIRILAKRMGLEEANKDAGENLLKRDKAVMIFPEGAAGNFKPTSQRYHLQEFRRGFVRMAMATKAPIVPVVVIGAEETNINLSSIPLTKVLKGTIIPIPLNVIPLPAKWKIIFLPPIPMKKYSKKHCADHELVHALSESVKAQIQNRINQELAKREWIYFPVGKSNEKRVGKSNEKRVGKSNEKPVGKSNEKPVGKSSESPEGGSHESSAGKGKRTAVKNAGSKAPGKAGPRKVPGKR